MHVLPRVSPVTRHRSCHDFADAHRQRGRWFFTQWLSSDSWICHPEQRTKSKELNACFGQRAGQLHIGLYVGLNLKTLNITCLSVAVVIYLVSFEPDLSLLSGNPNVTLMWEDGTCGQREEQLKNIRAGW